ncbi:MAG: RsmE family RNA methyltransferase [Minisyncoccia bacterium]|jgi:16S rRNA (uracil1498-N3)-methyltransferase
MRLYRFLVQDTFNSHYLRIIDEKIIKQWLKVLRLKEGDEVILINGQNQEALVKLINISHDFIEGEIIEVRKNQNEPKIETYLYCSILKKENFELVVQKATEVGVKEIIPLITSRTIKLNLNQKRLEKIVQEAAEQAGRGIVPLINNPVNFENAIQFARNNDLNILFDPEGTKFTKNIIKNKNKIGVFIGPEGGWDDKEIDLAQRNNFKIISLGKLILRAETAAIIAPYLIINS